MVAVFLPNTQLPIATTQQQKMPI